MRNFKLTIEYNGANFSGWQKQDGKRTVQGQIEEALKTITGEDVTLNGSGRTDKGVHALGQVASVVLESPITVEGLKRALNNVLPDDVFVKKVEVADDNFHARFSAKRKTYQYVVQVGGDRSAVKNTTLAYFPYAVDLKKMEDAAALLIGKHNFKGFCSSGTTVKDFEREIFALSIKKRGRIFTFEVTGNGFLYNMVRIIVGTLLDVGRGKLSLQDVKDALELGKRECAGQTMAACGLYLKKVEYFSEPN